MNQLAISFDAPRARRTDPATSHAAATTAKKFASGHAARILDALQKHGPRSAHELSLLIGLSVVQIDRRLPELRANGWAQVSKTSDGADLVRMGCRVWEAT